MSAELPSHVVAAINFIGRGGGMVKSLNGFRKPPHTVPDAVNSTTNAFLAKICTAELTEEAEKLFQEVRVGLGYKRKDVSLTVASPTATLAAKDFGIEISYTLDERDPARYVTVHTMRELRDHALAQEEGFAKVFAGRFTEIEFALKKAARVEAIIDAIEALDGENGISVNFPSDYRDCVISVEGVDAQVRCTGSALEVIFKRAGGPAELIDAFAAVRDAFQISKVLSGLISD
jgi:hypothetical protein